MIRETRNELCDFYSRVLASGQKTLNELYKNHIPPQFKGDPFYQIFKCFYVSNFSTDFLPNNALNVFKQYYDTVFSS